MLQSTDIEVELHDLEAISQDMLDTSIINQAEFDEIADLVNEYVTQVTEYRGHVGDNWDINPVSDVKINYPANEANLISLVANLKDLVVQLFTEGEINVPLRNSMNNSIDDLESLGDRF